MNPYSILFVCEPIIDIFIHHDNRLTEKYNIPLDGFILIDDDSDLKKCNKIYESLGGTSLNTFTKINTPGLFIGALNKDDEFIHRELNSLGKDYLFDYKDEDTIKCYVMIKEKFRSMITKKGAKLSLDFAKINKYELKRHGIFYISLFMWFENRTVLEYILGLKDYKVVLNLAPMAITDYKDLKFLIDKSQIIVGNKNEFISLFNLINNDGIGEEMNDDQFLKNFLKLSKTKCIVCTNGQHDIIFVKDDAIAKKSPIKLNGEEEIVTCGAGDAFCAGILDAVATGEDINTMVEMGRNYSASWIKEKTKIYENHMK